MTSSQQLVQKQWNYCNVLKIGKSPKIGLKLQESQKFM